MRSIRIHIADIFHCTDPTQLLNNERLPKPSLKFLGATVAVTYFTSMYSHGLQHHHWNESVSYVPSVGTSQGVALDISNVADRFLPLTLPIRQNRSQRVVFAGRRNVCAVAVLYELFIVFAQWLFQYSVLMWFRHDQKCTEVLGANTKRCSSFAIFERFAWDYLGANICSAHHNYVHHSSLN